MSAYIHQLPPTVALSQETMHMTLATNQVTNARARLDLELANAGAQVNQTWTIGWMGLIIQFTFKGNPNVSGTQLPVADPAQGVTKRYVAQLAEALMRNELVSQQFAIVIPTAPSGQFKLALVSRFDQPLEILSIAPVSDFNVTISNVASPFLKSNLTALVKVISRKGRELANLSGSYRIEPSALGGYEGRSTFDLGNLFDLAAHLPATQSLSPSVPFTNAVAFKAYAKYFLRCADKYGSPPVAESLFRTTPSYVIFGGRSPASTHHFAPNAEGFYPCAPKATRLTTKQQPNWVYLFPTEHQAELVTIARLYLDDGTFVEDHCGDFHALRANRIYYYRTGFAQLKLADMARQFNVADRVVAYEWLLFDPTNGIQISQKYKLEDCRHDSLYIAYANGLGGIDTLHLKGGYTQKTEAERTDIRRTDEAASSNPRIGAIATTDATMQRVWQVSTGLLTPQHADQLRQLLVGDVWLIDTDNSRFLKVVADSKSIETRAQNNNMLALNLELKAAWIDRNAV